MDDLDMNLLKHFADLADQMEQAEPEQEDSTEQLGSVYSAEDELLKAMELELFEKLLEEKEQEQH